MLAKREWLKHAVRSCKWNKGVRRLCHDAILKVVRDMMESAGFEDVVIEDRWWDEGDGEAKDTRRPDITAFNPGAVAARLIASTPEGKITICDPWPLHLTVSELAGRLGLTPQAWQRQLQDACEWAPSARASPAAHRSLTLPAQSQLPPWRVRMSGEGPNSPEERAGPR